MPQTEIAFNLLAHLKQKAEACEPKIWHLNDGDIYAETPTVPLRIAEVEFAEDAEFIAAACPAMVLALIAEIERLQKELGAFRKHERERWESAVKAFGPIQKSEAAGE